VQALLSLPIDPNDSPTGPSLTLSSLANKVIYVSSFALSQRDMLSSAYNATNTTEADWTISHEPARERYAKGVQEMQGGSRIGFAKAMYSRIFFDDGAGDTEGKEWCVNKELGLEREDVDAATVAALERTKTVDLSGYR
jgi:hypothetical protein